MFKRLLFISAAVILAAAGLYFRAANTHTAKNQAAELVRTDAAGPSAPASLASLKAFVAGHMGASVSFTLQGSYDRAAAQAAAAATNANSQIYADAQKACGGKSDSVTQAKCNHAYLSAHLTNVAIPTPVPAPKLADYQYNLKAPFWAPDLAGALLLGAVVALGFSLPFGRRRSRH
jgi:hypothetical protein